MMNQTLESRSSHGVFIRTIFDSDSGTLKFFFGNAFIDDSIICAAQTPCTNIIYINLF